MNQQFGIKGFISTSFVDWPGKICSVVFLGGCGFRCPVCHNNGLVLEPESIPDYPLDEILKSLTARNNWIDGVTVTGGEPTIRKNLPDLLKLFRQCSVKVKLDTNGSDPEMLQELIDLELVDAVYMDVKAPLTDEDYAKATGVPIDAGVIKRSVEILKRSGLEVAFRTTVIPGLVEEPELGTIRRSLGDVPRFLVQPFRSKKTLDSGLSCLAEIDWARFEKMRRCFEIPSSGRL